MRGFSELHLRLLEELARPPRIELTTASDYKRLLAQSRFECPKFKSLKRLCFNPNACPPRPRPCETCQSWNRYKRVFKAKNSTQQRIDRAFKALQLICSKCRLTVSHYDEPNYMDECIRAISARQKLERINKGEIQVKQSEGPVFD